MRSILLFSHSTTVGIVEIYFAMSVQTIRCPCLPQPSQCGCVITAIPYFYRGTPQRGTEDRLLCEIVSTMSECNGYHVVMTGPQDVQTLFVTATPQISNGLIKVSPQFFLNKIWCNFPFCGHYKHIPLHSSTCTDGGSSLHDKHSWTCPCIVLLQLSLSLEIV